ncbi:HAMP domain-containing sensor histidine kinase [Pedobacter sp.]|jgi:signal transduction histidine kinase|uniref:sensor histidine kinase n=1 Tax=Pedobacter sp. TaxID=1411316 RepID=UPI002BD77F4F|nr:HAMP domain-containing sensor histidine kinase [Pedobacter sp.]HWW42676.1 HAMP domain-containing sensor histidine kinase [Pedobacter sp.]
MKLSTRYNRANLLTSLVILIITGIIYYVVIHFILTERLDRDLAVEENEIRQYTQTYQKLPLPASYLDQQVSYKEINGDVSGIRDFSYTTYVNPKEKEVEPGRSLVTTVSLKGKVYQVTITKSRVESEDLVRIILLITLGVTVILLLSLILINRFVLSRLWRPFYSILNRMKAFEVTKMENIKEEPTEVDEFRELNESVNAMAKKVRQDYKELKSFTDNASHEMMTPLAVINSKLDSLLQTETFTEQQGHLLEDIYHATGRLSRLHQSLLLLAKIENNIIPDAENIDIQEMLEGKIRQFHELFQKDGLEVNAQLEKTEITMSRYLADILLNNLFSNSVRHNHTGGHIDVKLASNIMVISNTGKDKRVRDRIFDRFSKSAESEGMGLGLAISKQICTLYGFELEYRYLDNMHSFKIYFKKNL